MAVGYRARPGGHDPYTSAPGSVRYVEGVADVPVALAAVDATELTRYFATESLGVGV